MSSSIFLLRSARAKSASVPDAMLAVVVPSLITFSLRSSRCVHRERCARSGQRHPIGQGHSHREVVGSRPSFVVLVLVRVCDQVHCVASDAGMRGCQRPSRMAWVRVCGAARCRQRGLARDGETDRVGGAPFSKMWRLLTESHHISMIFFSSTPDGSNARGVPFSRSNSPVSSSRISASSSPSCAVRISKQIIRPGPGLLQSDQCNWPRHQSRSILSSV